jgi:hypothetical protein
MAEPPPSYDRQLESHTVGSVIVVPGAACCRADGDERGNQILNNYTNLKLQLLLRDVWLPSCHGRIYDTGGFDSIIALSVLAPGVASNVAPVALRKEGVIEIQNKINNQAVLQLRDAWLPRRHCRTYNKGGDSVIVVSVMAPGAALSDAPVALTEAIGLRDKYIIYFRISFLNCLYHGCSRRGDHAAPTAMREVAICGGACTHPLGAKALSSIILFVKKTLFQL